jgi:hypothetical protein
MQRVCEPGVRASVVDADAGGACSGSQVIFRVRRPMYLINSTIFVEDGEGNVVGEVGCPSGHPAEHSLSLAEPSVESVP